VDWNNNYVFPHFKKLYPGITIDWVNKGTNQPQTLETALAAGAGPTIIYVDPTFVYGFEKAGYLEPLEKFAAQYDWKSKFLPWAFATGKYKGKLLAIPERLESMIMYYSPPVLKKHGWTVPKNYEELVAFCKEATKAGLIPMAGGNSDWHPATEWWLTSWWNNYVGPKAFYDALTGKAKFSDAGFVDGVANLKYFFDKKWIAGGTSAFFANVNEVAQSQVANGQAVFGPTGTWSFSYASTYFQHGYKWDWAQLPPLSGAVKSPVFPLSVGALLGINKHASPQDQEAAAAFLNYYEANPHISAIGLADAGRELGSLQAKASDFPAKTPRQMVQFYEDLIAASDQGKFGFATWTFLPAATDTYLWTDLENVLTGSLSPEAYCKNIQSHFEKDQAAGNVPPAPKPTAYFA
jgi:raffinose/stachyose/melibiose transport system substrate-binding protein